MTDNGVRRIRQDHVDALVATGGVRAVTIEPAPGEGWAVRLRLGLSGEAVVSSHHRPVRVWRQLNTLVAWLRARGIGVAEIRLQ